VARLRSPAPTVGYQTCVLGSSTVVQCTSGRCIFADRCHLPTHTASKHGVVSPRSTLVVTCSTRSRPWRILIPLGKFDVVQCETLGLLTCTCVYRAHDNPVGFSIHRPREPCTTSSASKNSSRLLPLSADHVRGAIPRCCTSRYSCAYVYSLTRAQRTVFAREARLCTLLLSTCIPFMWFSRTHEDTLWKLMRARFVQIKLHEDRIRGARRHPRRSKH
jgi:hypothetical protein